MKKILNKRTKAATLALLATAAMTVGSSASYAAVLCGASANFPVVIPVTLDGVYINLVTGVINTAGTVANWDFNAYSASGNLSFFATAARGNAYAGGGTLTTSPTVLAAGTPIGPSPTSTYPPAAGVYTAPAWRAGTTGYVGVAFLNEVTGVTNYGWVQMTTTAATGFPASVLGYCYDNTGAAIPAGTTPVSLQKFSVE